MDSISNKQKLMYELRKRRKDVFFWAISLTIVLILLIFICTKENSLYFVLSSMAQTLSFIIIILRVTQYQSCSGISINYLICFIIMISCRLITNVLSSYDIEISLINWSKFWILLYILFTFNLSFLSNKCFNKILFIKFPSFFLFLS